MSHSVEGEQYILVDSTYRDRTRFPLPSQFEIPFAANVGHHIFADPIIGGMTFGSGQTQAGSTTTTIVLHPTTNAFLNGSATDFSTLSINRFVEDYIEISGQIRRITASSPANASFANNPTITVSPALSGAPGAGVAFNLRRDIPIHTGTIATNGTTTTSDLQATALTQDGAYVGHYITFTSGSNAPAAGAIGVAQRITNYVGSSQIATHGPFANATTAGDTYEIHRLTRDNANYLHYSGSIANHNQYVCYDVECLNLTLPNQAIAVANGGNLTNYPYVLVEFRNRNAGAGRVLWSNNPNTDTATFVVPINDDNLSTSFVRLRCRMRQTFKFKPTDTLTFAVRLPNGELLQYNTDDLSSPLPPNETLQISATFGVYAHH